LQICNFAVTNQSINQSTNQSIKTNLYSTMCRKQNRGVKWQGLGGESSVKQFSL